MFAICIVLLWLGVATILYRKRIFIKVLKDNGQSGYPPIDADDFAPAIRQTTYPS